MSLSGPERSFFYSNARLPRDERVLAAVGRGASLIQEHLFKLDVQSLGLSEYVTRYFGDHLRKPLETLRRYSFILAWALASSDVPLERFVFVDYGAGTGVLSLLAKASGVGTVIHNDIYDVSSREASVIGQVLGFRADHYVVGELDGLIAYLSARDLTCNAVGSYDVIEHIYRIDDFFRNLGRLSNGSLTLAIASGANPYNLKTRRELRKLQLEREYEGRHIKWGIDPRDCLRPFFLVRKEMIASHDPTLSEDIVESLARATRGLMEQDISQVVDRYNETGCIPDEPEHPTNTCDPFTGNWAERFLDISALEDLLHVEHYQTRILGGYYGGYRRLSGRLVGWFQNLAITMLGRRGLVFAPYYMIYARR